MKLGAHQSIEGGYTKALERIHGIGGNCLQIFSTSPRGWNFAKIDEVGAAQFKELRKELRIDPVYFHASYLINLANEGSIGHLSKLSLISELTIASKLQVAGSIVHIGSFKNQSLPLLNDSDAGIGIVIRHIKEILQQVDNDRFFIIENAGNNKIGKKLEEIAEIVKGVDNPRVKVCLDTCHLTSAGYDIRSGREIDAFLHRFDSIIGLERLEVIHANDSRDPFGSGRDRHENIGKGTLGIQTFQNLLNHPRLKHLPFIIETPGFDQKGPDKQNLDILKSLGKS